MEKKFKLSENKSTMEDEDGELTHWYREDFVKEFILRLKEEINSNLELNRESWEMNDDPEIAKQRWAIAKLHNDIIEEIDKLTGDLK